LHGLPAVLQKQLLGAKSADLPTFAPSVSFVDRDTLLHAAPGLSIVGFSEIAYDKHHNALVYSEDCLIIEGNTECGGDGYWVVQSGGAWRLKKHA